MKEDECPNLLITTKWNKLNSNIFVVIWFLILCSNKLMCNYLRYVYSLEHDQEIWYTNFNYLSIRYLYTTIQILWHLILLLLIKYFFKTKLKEIKTIFNPRILLTFKEIFPSTLLKYSLNIARNKFWKMVGS